jgi:hypothetical protein
LYSNGTKVLTSYTNTTYSAGTGLSLSGTTFNHSNSVTAVGTAGLYKVKYDAQGHITGTSAITKSDITGLGIPESDTNTTYDAGAGLSLSGTTFSHADTNTNISKDTSYGPTANVTQTAKNNATFTVPQITLDQFGHVKSVTERTITVTDTDTNTDTNTHYTSKNIVGTSSTATSNGAVTGTGGVFLNHLEESTVKSTHKIVGSGTVKVTSDSSGNITITGTDTNTDTNYYHTREYSSGLKISTGTGVSDMYVPTASTTQDGAMTSAMVTKLNGIAAGATANAGTVTGVKINGTTKNPSSGVVDLGEYLQLSGGTMTGCIITPGNDSVVIKPANNNYDQIGASNYKFWKIFATTFYGNLDGNATSATNATKATNATFADYATQVRDLYADGGCIYPTHDAPEPGEYDGIAC